MMQAMPELQRDMNLLAFSNGVLELATGTFTPSDQADPSRVARHYIPAPYPANGPPETPHMDYVLSCQLTPAAADLVYALMGRTLFAVNKLDQWQVAPCLTGQGKGKGLISSTVESFFRPESVGTLSSNARDRGALADKEVVVAFDMPHQVLRTADVVSMMRGDMMATRRMYESVVVALWRAPLFAISCFPPSYEGRRQGAWVQIGFDRVIEDPRRDLRELIRAELPSIICKALQAYAGLRTRVEEAGGDLWAVVPVEVRQWNRVV